MPRRRFSLVGTLLVVAFFVAAVLFLRGFLSPAVSYPIRNAPGTDESRFPVVTAALTGSLTTAGRVTGVYVDALPINEARLQAIRKARRTVHFETYFMTPGSFADAFAGALAERARAGVKVRVIVDADGTKYLPGSYWRGLRDAGAEVRFFNPFDWKNPLRYNSRNHRKLLLVDGEVALVGGAGVSDVWRGRDAAGETAPWREIEVRLEGRVLSALEGAFMRQWGYVGGTVDLGAPIFQEPGAAGSPTLVTESAAADGESEIRALHMLNMLGARARLWIASPYFLPGPQAIEALLAARSRGVDVRILTVGPHPDKALIRYAAREGYGPLLAAGVPIHEYAPAMMHAKIMLIDDRWVSWGSANFDPRSFFHNDELDLTSSDPRLLEETRAFFEDSWAKAPVVTRADWERRPAWEMALGRGARFFRWQL